jgi:hypothetical protein
VLLVWPVRQPIRTGFWRTTRIFNDHLKDQVTDLFGDSLPADLPSHFAEHGQYNRNPPRCQRTTVSGETRRSASFHLDQNRPATTQNSLSNGPSRGLGCLRFNAASCWRRARFSSIQASACVKDAKDGSKPELKELEHGANVIADRIFSRIPMLFISKPDRIVARYRMKTDW